MLKMIEELSVEGFKREFEELKELSSLQVLQVYEYLKEYQNGYGNLTNGNVSDFLKYDIRVSNLEDVKKDYGLEDYEDVEEYLNYNTIVISLEDEEVIYIEF